MIPQSQVQELLGRMFATLKKEDNMVTILVALSSAFMGHAKATIEMAPREAFPFVKKLLDTMQKFIIELEQEDSNGRSQSQ